MVRIEAPEGPGDGGAGADDRPVDIEGQARHVEASQRLEHELLVELDQRPERRRSEEHTSELQSQSNLVCRLLLEKKNGKRTCDAEQRKTLSQPTNTHH